MLFVVVRQSPSPVKYLPCCIVNECAATQCATYQLPVPRKDFCSQTSFFAHKRQATTSFAVARSILQTDKSSNCLCMLFVLSFPCSILPLLHCALNRFHLKSCCISAALNHLLHCFFALIIPLNQLMYYYRLFLTYEFSRYNYTSS